MSKKMTLWDRLTWRWAPDRNAKGREIPGRRHRESTGNTPEFVNRVLKRRAKNKRARTSRQINRKVAKR